MKEVILIMFLVVFSAFSAETKQIENLDNVKEISIDAGSVKVEIRKTNDEKIELIGNEERIKNIIVKISGNILEIKEKNIKEWFFTSVKQEVKINIGLKNLEKVILDGSAGVSVSGFSGEKFEYELGGSGNVKLTENNFRTYLLTVDGSGSIIVKGNAENFKMNISGSGSIKGDLGAEKVDVLIDGSGEIELNGHSKELAGKIEGAGSIDAFDLKTFKSTIEINGSGNVSTYATEEFTGTVGGSGNIKYSGNPKIEKIIEKGSGKIIKK